jgi:hypothetical protein
VGRGVWFGIVRSRASPVGEKLNLARGECAKIRFVQHIHQSRCKCNPASSCRDPRRLSRSGCPLQAMSISQNPCLAVPVQLDLACPILIPASSERGVPICKLNPPLSRRSRLKLARNFGQRCTVQPIRYFAVRPVPTTDRTWGKGWRE